ncbi:MAG: hypothetical protein GF311_08730 [Candidatus Lokiarchaeota archaeon]|nr:hypothetical protein [Candidatus Lokiarchaeota archaeon]
MNDNFELPIKALKERLDSIEKNDELIDFLFEITETLWPFEEYKEGHSRRYKIRDKSLKNEILIPTIETIFETNDLRENFLDKFENKLDSLYSFEYKILLETIIRNLGERKIKRYFQDDYRKLFDIILALKNDPIDGFWESEFVGCIGESLSSEYLRRLGEAIENRDLNTFFDLHFISFFDFLDRQDSISIIKKYNMIEFLIIEFSKMNNSKRNAIIDSEFGLMMRGKFLAYTKPFLIERIRKIVKEQNYDKISALIHLQLHNYLDKDEREDLFVEYNYTLSLHLKQGDHLANHLRYTDDNAKLALFGWAKELDTYADQLEELIQLFEGKELEIVDAQTHYISLRGDQETLEKAAEKGLIYKDKTYIYYP